jgi:hypothetical protein
MGAVVDVQFLIFAMGVRVMPGEGGLIPGMVRGMRMEMVKGMVLVLLFVTVFVLAALCSGRRLVIMGRGLRFSPRRHTQCSAPH